MREARFLLRVNRTADDSALDIFVGWHAANGSHRHVVAIDAGC